MKKTIVISDLWTPQQIEDSPDAPVLLQSVLSWTKVYLTRPHPALGRSGPVCPFVAPAFRARAIWFALANDVPAELHYICQSLEQYLRAYQALPAASPESARELRSLIIVYPSLIAHPEAANIVQSAHSLIKPSVIDEGLMLGEFFPSSNAPGLHNPEFRPLRSLIPLFVYRELVPNDLTFLTRPEDPLDRRLRFVRSYLSVFRPRLSVELLNKALEAEKELQHELERMSVR